MKKKLIPLLSILFVILMLNSQVHEDVMINARVESRCKIEISSTSVSFTRVNPDVERLIAQNEAPVEITVKATPGRGERVNLRIQAEGDLIDHSTGQKIDIENISWTASGQGFRDGILSKSSAQMLGRWNNSGVWEGTVTFYLLNRMDYAPGTYQVEVTLSVSSF